MKPDLLEIDNTTGEILIPSVNIEDMETIKQTKIKAVKLLSKSDFCLINGVWEAKRDGLIKILSSLPISYSWEIKEKKMTDSYSEILGELSISTGSIVRKAQSMGICEYSELKGTRGLHFMNSRAETRALKRAIEVLFGSVINWYVITILK